MLTVSPLSSTREFMENFSIGEGHDFADLSDGNLLECIDFDDLFAGIDVLPDLEVDTEFLAEFSLSSGGSSEELSEMNSSVSVANRKSDFDKNDCMVLQIDEKEKQDEDKGASSDSGSNSGSEEIVSKRDQSVEVNPSPKEGEKGRKSSSSAQSKNPQGKRKVKVDWTPELHRRFVQAVEQLGLDKAVPSRILEIMGIDCLTRHNIASHLQKYRSHRKHMLAREVEAARWSQRRQAFGGGGGGKREINPWLAPTMGFPPMTPPPMHHFRPPLHVWGHHHTMDPSFMHMWPKHPPPTYAPSPPPAWSPRSPAPPPDSSYWHQRGPNAPTPGTPCFPQPLTTTRFGSPPVPGIPPPRAIGVPAGKTAPPPPILDFHPSKESIDAAISDVLSKPWLPLPLGLKAPALDGVIGKLQKQGVPKLPPSCA